MFVLIGHSGNTSSIQFMTGQTAVQTFYIISGFYMSMILNEKYVKQPNAYSLFLSNRLLRLFPIYWVVLIVTALFSVTFGIVSHSHDRLALAVYSTVRFTPFSFIYLALTNLFLLGQDAVMFMGIDPQTGHFFFTSDFWQTKPELHKFLLIPQAWTLGLELLFYLVAPLLVRRSHSVVWLVIGLSLLLRLFLYNRLNFTNDPWTYRFFPTEIMFFLLGTLAYILYKRVREQILPAWLQPTLFVVVIITTIMYAFLPSGRLTGSPFTYREIGYFSVIVLSIPYLFNFSKNYKLDNQIGELSYPIYISHMFVILFIHRAMPFFLFNGWFIALATILFSYLLNRFVAAPVEKIRQRRVQQPVTV
jgi:peptidoglycan/LPS O-acetylase OafA/YrhL